MNKVFNESCLTGLPKLEENSVQCCVTSPPYYGLRDYGHSDQLGLEETPEEYVENMVKVFREVRRVLKKDGTLWLNLGDSYNSSSNFNSQFNDSANRYKEEDRGSRKLLKNLKPKDLIGIPWRVALALQADGWYLRQDIIWHKPNPMPESVTDRCTKAHEYIFLLTKSDRYYYDAEAINENVRNPGKERPFRNGDSGTMRNDNGRLYTPKETRNRRSVWTVATQPYKEAHFAVFPPALITPCIQAGSKEGDLVLDPFFGSGTTGEVALRLYRQYVGFEINKEYIALSEKRLLPHLQNLFTI